MPQQKNSQSGPLVEDLIAALSDKRVLQAISGIFEHTISGLQAQVGKLEHELNVAKAKIVELEQCNKTINADQIKAKEKIDGLEAYNRQDNLIIAGLPSANYAEAASGGSSVSSEIRENSVSTEQAVIQLANDVLNVPLKPEDISIAHRISKQRTMENEPARIIVRFTNRKVRSSVYAARRNLREYSKSSGLNIYINEDLTSSTADLFRRVREMVKRKVFHSCWTSGGVVFVRKSAAPDSRPVKLSLSTNLQSL